MVLCVYTVAVVRLNLLRWLRGEFGSGKLTLLLVDRLDEKKFRVYFFENSLDIPLWGVNSQCPVLQLACTKGSGMNIMNLLCFSEW